MSQRHRKMERLLKVQEQLHKMAELKLVNLQREASRLKDEQDALIQTMNDHDAFHGLFVDVMAKRLQTLAGQAAQVETAKVAQKEITFERAMQVKRTEKLATSLKDESRKNEEKKELNAILEMLPAKVDASFP